MPSTTDRLADALTLVGAPADMIQRAKEGYYDDFKSPLPMPLHQLVMDCHEHDLEDIAQRVIDGEFDSTKEESDAWAASPEGQQTFAELIEDAALAGDDGDDPRLNAAADMIRRTGAKSLQLRISDDPEPDVYIAIVEHLIGEDNRPVPEGGVQHFETGSGLTPLSAALRLCERLIDGGVCAHCGKLTRFNEFSRPQPPNDALCWNEWDPGSGAFRRGCEERT